ncbi:hypothetical protein WKK05_37665 (plasmid) [Nostoc sp. UHCC 0302]|uniref:hypothetical protein n=1 Tax=Nostoc sp. UHCC 0302 TaxID=3134896 RepID=UPI00311C91BF
MARPKSGSPNFVNVTLRVEEEHLNKLKLYSQVVGKNQTEVLREVVISALNSIPEHQRKAMETIAQCRRQS